MKKRWMLIVLLVSAVLTSMVEGSSAIYTWSKTFDFDMTLDDTPSDIPIPIEGFRKYEMKGIAKTSNVSFDEKANEITINGEAGAFRLLNTKMIPSDFYNYSVHARITELNPKELKNFGVTFFSSHADNGNGGDTYTATGYVMKFNQAGELCVEAQSIQHSYGENNVTDDEYGTFDGVQKENYRLLTAAEVKEKLGSTDLNGSLYVDIYVHKEHSYDNETYASFYINKKLINIKPLELKVNYHSFQTDKAGYNISIGVSSYQTRNAQDKIIASPLRHVKVNELYFRTWDYNLPPSQ